ncbi:unnamed protein product [Caenorhabditis angaria]|uniref:C2H2-type domain-containing protein n=1 Tax=Caenorhabditis angaria TaxID=860376 RepID=A0A9P1IKG0_9PELO|nr:unnamed protein product [Caenorhabditis angaria]
MENEKFIAPRRTLPQYGPRILEVADRPKIQNHKILYCEPSTSTKTMRTKRRVEPYLSLNLQKQKNQSIVEEHIDGEDPYVGELRKLFKKRQKSKNLQDSLETKIGEFPEEMTNRILKYGFRCDVESFSCLYPACGRTFESIEVLAFHLSYSHQAKFDASNSLICLVCGRIWNSVKTKLNHVSSKHRNLGEEHNSQCLLQDVPVISPDAPKAIRLVNNSLKSRFSDQFGQNVVVFQNEIDEDDPFIVDDDNYHRNSYF